MKFSVKKMKKFFNLTNSLQNIRLPREKIHKNRAVFKAKNSKITSKMFDCESLIIDEIFIIN